MSITEVEELLGGRTALETILQRIQSMQIAQMKVPTSGSNRDRNYLLQNECAKIVDVVMSVGLSQARNLLDNLVEAGLIETEKTGEQQVKRTRYKITENGMDYCKERVRRMAEFCQKAEFQVLGDFSNFCSELPPGLCETLARLHFVDLPEVRTFLARLAELPDEKARIKLFNTRLVQAKRKALKEIADWAESHVYHREMNRHSTGMESVLERFDVFAELAREKKAKREEEVARLLCKKRQAETRAINMHKRWTDEERAVWALVYGGVPANFDQQT